MPRKQKSTGQFRTRKKKSPNDGLTVLALAPCQQTAWWWQHFGPGGIWAYAVTDKYGPWRAAEPGEEGIPCDVEISVSVPA